MKSEAILSTSPAALGWRNVQLGRVKIGYLLPGDPGRKHPPRWQLSIRSDRLNGYPSGAGKDEEDCRRQVVSVLRLWLSAAGCPTEWVQTLRWED